MVHQLLVSHFMGRALILGKSLGSKTVGGDNYGPWIAFLAACIALGCIV